MQRVRGVDGVIDVLPPAQNGSSHIEVQFRAPDQEGAARLQERLQSTAELHR
jgi:hypothetical protein